VWWIDPNFTERNLIRWPQKDDDRPPSEALERRQLVVLVCIALPASPLWNEVLLLVVYDSTAGSTTEWRRRITGINWSVG
jgi:hypothetical protein